MSEVKPSFEEQNLVDNLVDKVSNLEQAVSTLIDKVNGLEERMLWGFEENAKMVDHVSKTVDNLSIPMTVSTAGLIDVKNPQPYPTKATPIPGDSPPTLLDALKNKGLNADDIEVLPNGDIKPKKFLGDLWTQYRDTIQSFGYQWISDGKNSHFTKSSATTQTPPAKTQTQIPPSNFEELVKEEMAKAAGLLTREAAIYLVNQRLAEVKADPSFMRIADVNSNMKEAKIKARVLSDPAGHERIVRGETRTVYDFEVDDGSAVAKMSYWNASPPQGITGGKTYAFSGLQVKEPYNGKQQLTIVKSTQWAPVA